jgi:hypothetical protein
VANGDQINLKPQFQLTTVPCEGEAGDLLVLSPLKEGEPDPSAQGLASLWFCTKSGTTAERPAIWARVQFDGIATCRARVPTPPQNLPTLKPDG